MAQGGFDVDSEDAEKIYRGDYKVLIESVREIREKLSDTLSRISEAGDQVATAILLLFYFAVLMIPAIIPTLPGAAFCNSLGVIGWTVIYMTIFLIWRRYNGKPVVNLMNCFNNLPWPC